MRRIGKVLETGVRAYSSSSVVQSAKVYRAAYIKVFSEEQRILLNNHEPLVSAVDDHSVKHFSGVSSNQEIRERYECKAFSLTIQRVTTEYIETNPHVDATEAHFVTREVLKYSARGKMIELGKKEDVDVIHRSNEKKGHPPVGVPFSVLKAKKRPDEMQHAAYNKKRDAGVLKKDMEDARKSLEEERRGPSLK